MVEKEGALLPALRLVHGKSRSAVQVGPKLGDVMKKPLTSWRDAHGLIVGPPCPPWSLLGKRGGVSDSRAGVFEKMIDVIVDLARNDRKIPLRWFIIENVEGLMKKVGGQDRMIDNVQNFAHNQSSVLGYRFFFGRGHP